MTSAEVLSELESLGSEQTRKTYRRHGITGDVFGVSFANLEKLQKRIKINHELAVQLWKTGNHDARILATKIADPKQLDVSTADSWVKNLDSRAMVDAFTGLLVGSPVVRARMEKWLPSKDEWIARTGWTVLARLAGATNDVPDALFEAYLDTIEKEIHKQKNYVREAMNSALIAIGTRNDSLRKRALVIAKKIGKVAVDHGDTACKTPDAAEYIDRVLDRRAKKNSSK